MFEYWQYERAVFIFKWFSLTAKRNVVNISLTCFPQFISHSSQDLKFPILNEAN